MESVAGSSGTPSLLQQLENVMIAKERENEVLRRRVELLEAILKQHGIHNVVPVEKTRPLEEEKEENDIEALLKSHARKVRSSAESTTSNTDSQSESVSSLTNAEDNVGRKRQAGKSAKEKTRLFRKVTTICEEDDDERDDDASVRTSTTTSTAATGYTRRALIMLPEQQRPKEPEPYPPGTSAGGRWYRLTHDKSFNAKPYVQPFSCHCADGVDSKTDEFIYYDRQGTRKYFSPAGMEVENPLQRKGTILKVLPHDGTILSYFMRMGLPLYHQKQRPGKQMLLKSSDFAIKEFFEV